MTVLLLTDNAMRQDDQGNVKLRREITGIAWSTQATHR